MTNDQKRRTFRAMVWWAVMIFTFLLWYTIVLVISQALAHSAPSGWKYPADCCDPEGWECDPIPEEKVKRISESEWEIDLEFGDHKNVPLGGNIYRYPTSIRPSGDNQYHGCISKNGYTMHCLFVPYSM